MAKSPEAVLQKTRREALELFRLKARPALEAVPSEYVSWLTSKLKTSLMFAFAPRLTLPTVPRLKVLIR